MAATYVDSSALVKLVIEEPESVALRRHLRRTPLVSSALVRTEVVRAVLAHGNGAVTRAHSVVSVVDLVRVSDQILRAAGTLLPLEVRSLDAIHLATALHLRSDVGTLVTYDERMTTAARALDLRTVSPA